MELTFEKWEDGRWFVILPEYDGEQEDLEMVDGADTFLDFLTEDGLYVTWLCNVVHFIYGEHPENIYFRWVLLIMSRRFLSFSRGQSVSFRRRVAGYTTDET